MESVGGGEDNGDGQPKLQVLGKVEDRGKQHLDLGAGRNKTCYQLRKEEWVGE